MSDDKLCHWLETQGYRNLRRLPTGELAGTMKMLMTTGLFVGLDESGWRTRFCYEDDKQAREVLEQWDGRGFPPGWWIKQKPEETPNPKLRKREEAHVISEHYAVHNPHDKPVEELPVIYGFNNGGYGDNWSGMLMAEDGTVLGGHVCSGEGWMLHDLGIIEGNRPDRHDKFREHYPAGYRMDFVSFEDVKSHPVLGPLIEKGNAEYQDAGADPVQGPIKSQA